MKWPSPQDYREAIQNPEICLSDPELQRAELVLDSLQLPLVKSGQFATVFTMKSGKQKWAVRCFLHNFLDRHERYKHIADFILRDDLEYTVDFELIENGIKVDSEWFPILKMEHVDGTSLGKYFRDNFRNPETLRALLARFEQMCQELKEEKIAHGDLQHDNVIITPEGRLRLIDYDGMFVPALTGRQSNELGHRNYQHPERSSRHFGISLDNFSQHVISLSLKCLIEDSSLSRFIKGDECLLFSRDDYLYPERSKLLYTLEQDYTALRDMSRSLRSLLLLDLSEIPSIGEPLVVKAQLPDFMPLEAPVDLAEPKPLYTAQALVEAEPLKIIEGQSTHQAYPRSLSSALYPTSNLTQDALGCFPSRFLYTEDGRNSYAYSSKVVQELEKQLPGYEKVLWKGGLSPTKISTNYQDLPTLNPEYPSIKAIILCALPVGVFWILLQMQVPVPLICLLTFFFIVVLCLLASSLLKVKKTGLKHAAYLLSDRALHVCNEGSLQQQGLDNTYWDIFDTEIPLHEISFANFYDGSEALQERVELGLKSLAVAGAQASNSSLWLYGFTKKDRLALLAALRSLGVECRQRI